MNTLMYFEGAITKMLPDLHKKDQRFNSVFPQQTVTHRGITDSLLETHPF